MSRPRKIDRNKLILFLRDDENEKRTFGFIAAYLTKNGYGEISEKNVRGIYHRDKALEAIAVRRNKSL